MSLPYWVDDPLIPPGVHDLILEPVGAWFTAACTCAGWMNPQPWGDYAQMEAFDEHMLGVQCQLRGAVSE
jgi:hypothetical protein